MSTSEIPHTLVDDRGDQEIRCPLCPQPREHEYLMLLWDATTPVMDICAAMDAIALAWNWSWKIACVDGHVLATSADFYEDDETPPAPTVQQLHEWLNNRKRPGAPS